MLLVGLTATAQEFYKGADVGWMTEMESKGHKWYNAEGKETEYLQLMKEYGINAVRLRVWVDPAKHDNWCNLDDVIGRRSVPKSWAWKSCWIFITATGGAILPSSLSLLPGWDIPTSR